MIRRVEEITPADAARALGSVGMKVENGYLHILKTGSAIEQLLVDTPWAGGRHAEVLLRLPGALDSGSHVLIPMSEVLRPQQRPRGPQGCQRRSHRRGFG